MPFSVSEDRLYTGKLAIVFSLALGLSVGGSVLQEIDKSKAVKTNAETNLLQYYGVKEAPDILLSPDQTERFLASIENDQIHAYFEPVKDAYLIQEQNGDSKAYLPATHTLVGKEAVFVESGVSVIDQLETIHKGIIAQNAGPEFIRGILGNEQPDMKAAHYTPESKKDSSDKESTRTETEPTIENKKVLKDEFQGSKMTISDEDKAQIMAAATKNETESGPEKGQGATVTSSARVDMDALRAQLRKRVQGQLSGTPKAQETIDQHFGSSAKSSQQKQPQTVSDHTLNVGALRETKSAVIYKDDRLVKVGYDMEGNETTEEGKRKQVQAIMKRIIDMGDRWSVIYPAIGEEKKKIAVFSDPTCPYCQKLYKETEELRKAGVTIYHMFYNRNMSPSTYNDPRVVRVNRAMKNAWCSEDPREALNNIYSGYAIPDATCPTNMEEKLPFPGNEHYLIGRLIDMNGTPYTITEDGKIVSGFSTRPGVQQPRNFLSRIGVE